MIFLLASLPCVNLGARFLLRAVVLSHPKISILGYEHFQTIK
uniref:Uncharacterized protein n=1 Tax=Arundo donax TaxID=35708 RepID=A0A0A9U5N3_ARUDO